MVHIKTHIKNKIYKVFYVLALRHSVHRDFLLLNKCPLNTLNAYKKIIKTTHIKVLHDISKHLETFQSILSHYEKHVNICLLR